MTNRPRRLKRRRFAKLLMLDISPLLRQICGQKIQRLVAAGQIQGEERGHVAPKLCKTKKGFFFFFGVTKCNIFFKTPSVLNFQLKVIFKICRKLRDYNSKFWNSDNFFFFAIFSYWINITKQKCHILKIVFPYFSIFVKNIFTN